MPQLNATEYQDYIPGPDADALLFFQNMTAQLNLQVPPVPGFDEVAFAPLVANFDVALSLSTNPLSRTSPNIEAKNEARAIVQAQARICSNLAVAAFRNGAYEASDLEALGFRVPSTVRTPRPAPAVGPSLELRSIMPGQVDLIWSDPISNTRRRPIGVNAIEVWARPVGTAQPPVLIGTLTRATGYVDTSGFTGVEILVQGRYRSNDGSTSELGTAITFYAS